MRKTFLAAFILSAILLLGACGNPNQRLDEYVFYDGPQFKLKVVRYYRNIPFNYLGEHAVVMCQSRNTTAFDAHDQQDAGWRTLAAGGGQGSTSAVEAAATVKDNYQVLDDHTVVTTVNVFNISFDACGHFINWDPSRLPPSMIDPVEKPDSCAPNGPADCRYYDFEGDRAPRYEEIIVNGMGRVAFTAASKTFKGVERLRVRTGNNGAVWHVEIVGHGTGEHRLKAGSVRSTPVSSLETGMKEVTLMEWFEATLPPRSMVVWPDTLGTCGKQDATAQPSHPATCAEIRFTTIEGNSGTLYIAMTTDSSGKPWKAAFHSGVYKTSGFSSPVSSLSGLRESLSGKTN